jgi:hypothetical protein
MLKHMEKMCYYTWYQWELGRDTFTYGYRYSFLILLNILFFLTRDFSLTQYFYWIIIYSISGLSMFCLADYLFKRKTNALISSLIWSSNQRLLGWIVGQLVIWQSHAFMPFAVLCYLLFLETKKIKYIIYLFLSLLFIIPYPHYTFLTALIIFFFLFHSFLAQKNRRLILLKDNIILLTLLSLLLSFYLIPFLFSLFPADISIEHVAQRFSTGERGIYWGSKINVIHALTMTPSSAFAKPPFYESLLPLFTCLPFIIPFLCIIPLMSNRNLKELNNIYLIYIMFILGIFISSIVNINVEFYKLLLHIPLFGTLLSVSPGSYFPLIYFSASLLSGLGYSLVINKIVRRMKSKIIFMIFFIVIFILFLWYPMVFWNDYRFKQVQYPSYYDLLVDNIDSDAGEFRVYVLPPWYSVKYDWAPYFMDVWLPRLFQKSAVSYYMPETTLPYSYDFLDLLNSHIKSGTSQKLVNVLRLANVKYIVAPMDVAVVRQLYNAKISSQKGIALHCKYGSVYVYKISDEYFLPKIYAASNIYIYNSLEEMFKNLLSTQLDIDKPAIFLSSQLTDDELNFINSIKQKITSNVEIEFQKISPVKYKIRISGDVGKQFVLVFSESYSSLWKLYQGDVGWLDALWETPISEKHHYIVNGYANAWYLDLKENNATNIFTIYFFPQTLLYIGWLITISTFIIILINAYFPKLLKIK